MQQKNFKLIRKDIYIEDFKLELSNFLERGNRWSFERSSNLKVHKNTKHIDIRKMVLPKKIEDLSHLPKQEVLYIAADSKYNELHLKNYQFFKKTYAYLEEFADSIGGQLTKVLVVSLSPHTEVLPHIDEGAYYVDKDRYHLPLQTDGSLNHCGDEQQIYNEGELWWFDNKKMHSAKNLTERERIHIIFDILMEKRSALRRSRDYFEKTLSDLIYERLTC